MKINYILYALLFVICSTSTSFMGCKKDTTAGGGEPLVWDYYFELKDKITDSDYWASHPTYKLERMTSTFADGVSNALGVDTTSLPNRKILQGTLAGTTTLYLDYHNNDIDTLRIDSYPVGSEAAQWVKLYFNGVLVKHFNFVNDPNLRSYLAQHNQQDKPRPESIIITLPK